MHIKNEKKKLAPAKRNLMHSNYRLGAISGKPEYESERESDSYPRLNFE